MKSLANYWYQTNFSSRLICLLLLPLSWLYCLLVIIRRKLYQLKLIKSYATETPLLVVGNIVVGGSGKTPLVIALCKYIEAHGFKPGVVSRGYGASKKGVHQIAASDSAELVGDEPLMIQQRTGVPVVIAADRVAAVDYLLKNNQCDIVLSDDGLQHYRMQRDFEISVIDSIRLFGNGYCLPAGPLREKVSRLQSVDLMVYNGEPLDSSVVEKGDEICCYTLEFVEFIHLNNANYEAIDAFSHKTVHAVAGIGHPERFFAQLREHDINVIEHAFADHHVFQQSDFSDWQQSCIIMTEKDAVKCKHLTFANAWFVRVSANLSKMLVSELDEKLLPLIRPKTML